MDGDNRDSGPLSINEYLDQLPDAPEEGQAPEEEEQQAEPETEEEEVEEEADEPEEQDEPEPDDEAPEAYSVSEYGEITVELKDGTRTTLSELANGNLRQSDYSRKTAEVAEERKRLDALAEDLAAKERQLNEFAASIEEAEPDWAKIADDDPLGWQLQKLDWDRKQAKKAQQRQEAQAATAREMEQFKAKTVGIALEAIPEWNTPGEFDKNADARKKAAIAAGFTEQEYAAAIDFRFAALLEWAARGRAKADAVTVTQKKLSKVPKVVKPGTSKESKADRDAAEKAARAKRLKPSMSVKEYLDWKG